MYGAILWCTQSHCALQHSPTLSKLSEEKKKKKTKKRRRKEKRKGKKVEGNMFTKVIHIWQLTTNNVNNYWVLIFQNADSLPRLQALFTVARATHETWQWNDKTRVGVTRPWMAVSAPFVSSILLWRYHAIGYTQLFIAGLAERSCCLPYSQKITRPVQGRLIPQALDAWNWKFGFSVGAGSWCELSECSRWGKTGLVRLEFSALSSLVFCSVVNSFLLCRHPQWGVLKTVGFSCSDFSDFPALPSS